MRDMRGNIGDVDGGLGDAFPETGRRSVRVWSRIRLRAIRMSQVEMEQSPRKLVRADQARRKVSCVRDCARSRSRIEARWKRKIRCS